MQAKRTDISDYVIHFLRRQDVKDLPFVFEIGGRMHLSEYDQIAQMTELECLFNIIAEGGLRGGFSFRNGKATIYGIEPTVCFTEMPLINLLEYSSLRKNPYRVSDYGIAVKKKDFFKKGGRPVIYGLSPDNTFEFDDSLEHNPHLRVIQESILPLKEQYRYVAFQLGSTKNVDWTHEREWRIVGKDDIFPNSDTDDDFFPGLYLFDGECFEEVIFIVKSKQDAVELERYIRPIQESGHTRSGLFYTNIKFLVLDLAIELFNQGKIKKIEDIPADVFYTFNYIPLSQEKIEKLHQVLEFCKLEAERLRKEYLETHETRGLYGWSHIVSWETDNPTIRYLFENGKVDVHSGYYVLKDIFNAYSQNLNCTTFIAEAICKILNERYENIFDVVNRYD